VVYPHKENRVVISSLSDVQRVSPSSQICFRKFISKRLVLEVLKRSENLRRIEISKSAYSRCDKECIEILKKRQVKIMISQNRGRPSFLEFNKELIVW